MEGFVRGPSYNTASLFAPDPKARPDGAAMHLKRPIPFLEMLEEQKKKKKKKKKKKRKKKFMSK